MPRKTPQEKSLSICSDDPSCPGAEAHVQVSSLLPCAAGGWKLFPTNGWAYQQIPPDYGKNASQTVRRSCPRIAPPQEMDIFLDEELRYDFFLTDWLASTSLWIEYSYSVETFFRCCCCCCQQVRFSIRWSVLH